MAALRSVPYPYRGMMAFTSDIDICPPPRFERIHRFLNTRSPSEYGALSPIGDGNGVGLDIGDSFFWVDYWDSNAVGVCNVSDSWATDADWYNNINRLPVTRSASDLAAARDPQTGRLTPIPAAERFVEKYLRCGWMDFVHGGYGEYDTKTPYPAGGSTDTWRGQTDGAHYREWLRSRGLRVEMYVMHASSGSDLEQFGDVPTDPYYWANHLRSSGCRFIDRKSLSLSSDPYGTLYYIERMIDPNDEESFLPLMGQGTLFTPTPITLRDGWKPMRFRRGIFAYGGIPNGATDQAAGLQNILTTEALDIFHERGGLELIYTHFGATGEWSDLNKRNTIDGFYRLRQYQDAGKILVCRSTRILKYNLARDYAVVTQTGNAVNIEKIADPSDYGHFVPKLDDVRGLTFYVTDSSAASVSISGIPVAEGDLVRNPADETGQQSIGIKWYEPDTADYTTMTLEQVNDLFPASMEYDFSLDFYSVQIPLGTGSEVPTNTDSASVVRVMRLPHPLDVSTDSDTAYMRGVMRLGAATETDSEADACTVDSLDALRYDFLLDYYGAALPIDLPAALDAPTGSDTAATLGIVRPFGSANDAATGRDLSTLATISALPGAQEQPQATDNATLGINNPLALPLAIEAPTAMDSASLVRVGRSRGRQRPGRVTIEATDQAVAESMRPRASATSRRGKLL